MVTPRQPTRLYCRQVPYQTQPLTGDQLHLARWRGQHIARALRDTERGGRPWIGAWIERYAVYDGRTQQASTPTPSPRTILIASHQHVDVPQAATGPVTIGQHRITVSHAAYQDALRAFPAMGVAVAWWAYVATPHPPTIFYANSRDGIAPGPDTLDPTWRHLRRVAVHLALHTLERETGEHYQ